MGKIRKAILRKEKENASLKAKKDIPPIEQEWDVSEEGFYKDEVEEWNDERDHLLLDPHSIEPASFSEDEGSDTEVLPLDLPDSADESDILEHSESETGGPSDRAWGHRKSSFYNADFVDDESAHSSDESLAEEEEKEAMALQKRLLESLDNQHFGLESLKSFENLQAKEDLGQRSKVSVTKELSDMSEGERFSLLEQQWPEFLELYGDLSDELKRSKNIISPLAEIVSAYPHAFTEAGSSLLKTLLVFTNLYCLNVMFYMTLRASHLPAEDHPVITRIIELRDILGKIKTGLGDFIGLEALLEKLKNTDLEKRVTKDKSVDPALREKKIAKRVLPKNDEEDPLEFYNRIKASKRRKKQKKVSFKDLPASPEKIEEDGSEGKRKISYQIAQNRGLTPKRKKDERNPRVKHRRKYTRAVKKYQKVVRPLEREMDRYGGEKGGIKLRLSRSIKLK